MNFLFSYFSKLRFWAYAAFVVLASISMFSIYSRSRVSAFYLDNAQEVLTRDAFVSIGDPLCRFKGLNFSDFEVAYTCHLKSPCPESASQIVRFSPFWGVYTFPDKLAETLAFDCPQVLKPNVLEDTLIIMQKGG